MASDKIYGPVPAGALPATLTIAATTETFVPNPILPVNTTVAIPLMVIIPSGSILEKRMFELLASGTITTAASETITAKLYTVPSAIINAGTAGTLANDTLVASSGAITQNSATVPFCIRLTSCVYDSTSGKLIGKSEFLIDDTVVAQTAFSSIITGVSNANDPVVGFLMTLTFSAAGGGSAIVQSFDINF